MVLLRVGGRAGGRTCVCVCLSVCTRVFEGEQTPGHLYLSRRSSRVFAPAPSLFISAGILIRALRASAGEVRRKLCFLTANKNCIISLIQVAHLEKNTN